MATSVQVRLKIQQIGQIYLFELSWGHGQQVQATLPYPDELTTLYRDWQRVYLSFYKTMPVGPPALAEPLAEPAPRKPTQPPAEPPLRGWLVASGGLSPSTTDWHTKLVEAETRLLSQFHRWLRSAELFDIRAAIARYSQHLGPKNSASTTPLDSDGITVFLTCTPLELARFPWEAWEIGTDFAAAGTIRIVRTPPTIRAIANHPKKRSAQRKARILAILGDDSGLNFQGDRDAVTSLARVAEIQFVGWQPGQTAAAVKTQIQQAIADPQGWDVLFFAGHSNETQVTGGEIAVAPGVAIALQEIAPQLTIARERGLQFAIFNSCSGLNIAELLIDLGFSQVAVMREPIHNQVAQAFLVRFLQTLADHRDVSEALRAASQFLRLEKNLTYPSAYLVPSLFCHPGATLFHIPMMGWKQRLQKLLPSRYEGIALSSCLLLSLLPPVQNQLLDQRLWVQSLYRSVTGQVTLAKPSPIVLVQIDEASIRRDRRIGRPVPISRLYLADLLDRLARRRATVIGVDYLLDRPIGDEEKLRQSIENAIAQNKTWFIFGTLYNDFEAKNLFTTEAPNIAQRQWTMQAHVSFFPNRVTLPYPNETCQETCPFAYLLGLTYRANYDRLVHLAPPKLSNNVDLRTQLMAAIVQEPAPDSSLTALTQTRLSWISVWAYEYFGQVWLEPIIDYSIPPDQIYTRIAAWRLIEEQVDLPDLSDRIILIGGGDYTDTDSDLGVDQYSLPPALRYWRDRLPPTNAAASFPNGSSVNQPAYLPRLTGVEAHAYSLHHLLRNHLILPIPDIWMVAIAIPLGKGAALLLQRQKQRQKQRSQWTTRHRTIYVTALLAITGIYGLAGLQLYISASLLFPWLLPSAMVWVYVLPRLREKV